MYTYQVHNVIPSRSIMYVRETMDKQNLYIKKIIVQSTKLILCMYTVI